MVNFQTRGHNLLDLVLSDDGQIINHIAYDPPIGNSDHCIIKLFITIENNGITTVLTSLKQTKHTTGIKPILMQLEDT